MIALVVPFSPGTCPGRDRAWEWVRARLEQLHPDYEIVTGNCAGEWSKGEAVADALSRTDADVIVMHDADSFVPSGALRDAVAAVEPGVWAMPQGDVHRLTEHATRRLYREGLCDTIDLAQRGDRVRHAYPCTIGGGIVAIHRADYERVPIDPRFRGWGGEDCAWGRALVTLVAGTIIDTGHNFRADIPHRGTAPLWHLDHPLSPSHRNRKGESPATKALITRYKAATGIPYLMEALVAGVDLEPEPPPMDQPVTFRLARQVIRTRSGKVRAGVDRLFTTDDAAVVHELRVHKLAQEVQP